MKKIRITAILIVLSCILSGCAILNKEESYAQTVCFLDSIVKEFSSDTFEQDFNDGKFNYPDDTLSASWSNMIVYAKNLHPNSFGYILKDINSDDFPELFFVDGYRKILAVFTSHGTEYKLLDAFWNRYQAFIDDDGLLYVQASGSAEDTVYTVKKLNQKGNFQNIKEFGLNVGVPYRLSNDNQVKISEEEFNELLKNFPSQNGSEWALQEYISITHKTGD